MDACSGSQPVLIGVLMTGMGERWRRSNDEAPCIPGGRTIAEAEETAVVWGMPGKLVEAGGASCGSPASEYRWTTEKAGASLCP